MDKYMKKGDVIAYIRKETAEAQSAFEELGGESEIIAEAFEDLADELEGFPAVSVPQWISVKDRLPEPDENPVLAGCEPFNMVFMAWYHRKTNRWELPSKVVCEVTHWIPTSSMPRMDGADNG